MKVLNKHIFKVFSLALLLVSFSSLIAKSELIGDNPEAVQLLSKCLKENGATMYGTANCGHCNKQKEMFGPYFKNVRFVDCRSSAANQRECNETKVGKFPQWNFENGRKIVREVGLEEIARVSGCDTYVAQALGNTNYVASQSSSPEPTQNNSQGKINSKKTNNSQESYSSNSASGDYGTPEELAKCLKAQGVVFYGSPKCSHCDKQKAMFEGAFEKYLSSNFHNCKGSAAEQAECSAKKTFPFPTWVDPNSGKKVLGPEKPLEVLAKAFNCNNASSGDIVENRQNSSSIEPSSNSVQSNSSTSAPEQAWGQREVRDELNNIKKDLDEANKNKPNNEDLQKSQSQPSSDQMVASAASPSYFNNEKNIIEFQQNKLANCIANRNIILYGITNPEKGKPIQYKATQQQLNELGAAANQIKVVDCSANQAECNGILVYPTWILDDKKELAGVYEFSNLAQIFGCSVEGN
ncbi:MAG: hypothetical protein SFU25_02180 [Candidatus Caenarcaniphilales bacterium]|nr:hypothetical protein [Candidatus Caenarcaniphilales bacterium]